MSDGACQGCCCLDLLRLTAECNRDYTCDCMCVHVTVIECVTVTVTVCVTVIMCVYDSVCDSDCVL